MQLAPNKTQIKATITQILDDGTTLVIVILKMRNDEILPAFLWTGKIVTAKNQSLENDIILNEGDIISTDIEVMGDPFKQVYLLHNISKL